MEYVEYYRVNRVNRIIVSVLGSNYVTFARFPLRNGAGNTKTAPLTTVIIRLFADK